MSSGRKPDADEIEEKLAELRSAFSDHRSWWPRFVYHSADLPNAASILNRGEILSRQRAGQCGVLEKDSAAPEIIGALTEEQKDWVRLYFRPRAPTQYANEGIRPKQAYEYGAHMAVPVFFLFSAPSVLTQEGCCFTKGRLRPGGTLGQTADYFCSIDFRKVYHDSYLPAENKEAWKDARHAEVLVRESLGLDHLLRIVCRSAPERDTLLHLLDEPTRAKWADKIIVEGGRRIFYKRGVFIEKASLTPQFSTFTFFLGDWDKRGPFDAKARWRDGSWTSRWEKEWSFTSDTLRFKLRDPHPRYVIELWFDDYLIYANRFVQTTEPEIF